MKEKRICPHHEYKSEIRVRKYDPDGEPTHVARQCLNCYAIVKLPEDRGYWLPREKWPNDLKEWLGGALPDYK